MAKEPSWRIDVHNHSVLKTYRRALRAELGDTVRLPEWSPERAIEVMDRHRIEAAVTSLSYPGTHLGDDQRAHHLARACNDESAANAERYPRLGAFATAPLPAIDHACTETVRALDELKLDGVCLLASYQGKYLGHADFDPLLEILNERDAVVLVHPTVHPSTQSVALTVPNFMLEYPFDTTRAAVNLIFADALHRFPRIKFILAHAGGTLPHLGWRIASIASYQMSDPPDAEKFLRDRYRTALVDRLGSVSPDVVDDLISRFYYDTALAPSPAHLTSLKQVTTADHVMFGSDWPYAYENFVRDEVAELDHQTVLDANEIDALNRGNALRLFPRLAAAIGQTA